MANFGDDRLPERFWKRVRVDTATGCWTWIGSLNKWGYGYFQHDGAKRRSVRVAWALLVGPIPAGKQLDHVCRNRACVNPAHLRLATRAQNNRHRQRNHSHTLPKGVTHKRGKYQAQIKVQGQHKYLGLFSTPEEAAEAYDRAAVQWHGAFALTNRALGLLD